MLEEKALVLSTEGNRAKVLIESESACASCQTKSVCGTSLLASLFPSRSKTFLVNNKSGAVTGQYVIIGLNEQALQSASLLVYLFPIIGLIGGAVSGSAIADYYFPQIAELVSIFAGLSSMALCLILVRRWSAQLSGKGRYQAKILRIIQSIEVIQEKV